MGRIIEIDGSRGEGGGQILRTALGLSLVTGRPFRIDRIRAGRKKPGLLRQHLTAVNAAKQIGCAVLEGAELGSTTLTFKPTAVVPGHYHFAVGTAGSATLVLQAILPALLTATGPSSLILEGGTHNPWAPPFDFLQKSFLPLVARMGPRIVAELERPGFHPAGGGRFTVTIEPVPELRGFELLERGEIRRRQARAIVSSLSASIGGRELKTIKDAMGWDREALSLEEIPSPRGPGNVVMIELESDEVTEVMTGFGEKGVSAEGVAGQVVEEARRYLAARVPVGEYLADQLIIPMALAGEGAFRTMPLTLHTTTNIEVVQLFLDIGVETRVEHDSVAGKGVAGGGVTGGKVAGGTVTGGAVTGGKGAGGEVTGGKGAGGRVVEVRFTRGPS